MTRSTPLRTPAAVPVVRYGVEWFAHGAWCASARNWETRRAAAEEPAAWCARSAPRRASCSPPRVPRRGTLAGKEVAHAD